MILFERGPNMSDETGIRHHLVSGSAVFIVLLGIAAWSSKPDEASFRRFIAREVSKPFRVDCHRHSQFASKGR